MVQIHCNFYFYFYFYFDHFNFLELIIVRMNLTLRTIDVRHEIFSMCRLWHSLVYSVLKYSHLDIVNVCQFALGSQFDCLLALIYTTESRLLLTKSYCFCQIRSLYVRKLLLNWNFIFYLKIAFFWLSNAHLFYFFHLVIRSMLNLSTNIFSWVWEWRCHIQ